MKLGADGTIIQQLPAALEQSNDIVGATPALGASGSRTQAACRCEVPVDPGAPGSGCEGSWVRAPSQEGTLFAETSSRDQVVVHLWSKIASAQAERLSRSGILTYFRRDR